MRTREKDIRDSNGFTRRQIDVLNLLAEQYTYDQMAERLGVSKNTLQVHVIAIMKITGIWKQILLVKYAQEHGYGKAISA